MREVTVAKNAGFCFGVKRATDAIEREIAESRGKRDIYTLGKLIHNDSYNKRLAAAGVRVCAVEELSNIARATEGGRGAIVFVRAHGVTRETYKLLSELSATYSGFEYTDCTCPFVRKIHRIAEENSGEGREFILAGAAEHPEVVGILSYFDGPCHVFPDADSFISAANAENNPFLSDTVKIFAAQTTFKLSEWKKILKFTKNLYTKSIFYDTICNVTENRQKEAEELASQCDAVIVIGGQDSSNTAKLYSICRSRCENALMIAEASELGDKIPSTCQRVGILAGASTPDYIIEEVFKAMNTENTNVSFDELLDSACKTLNTGDTVTGIVTAVSDLELKLDLGAKATGILTADQITDDASLKLSELYKIGDEIEVFVIRVSDVEGCATVSKKRADLDKNWHNIVDAKENNTTLEGTVTAAVRGGVTVSAYGARVFVPASQSGLPREADMSELVGKTVEFKVIEVKPQGKSAVGSIRAAAREVRRAAEEKFWSEIEVGKYYTGTVRGMTDYGVFIDLGGVDGMLHKKELTWKPIHKPSEIVNIGDTLEVFVKSFNLEKHQISLGYKTEEMHPWYIFKSQYSVGDVIEAKITSLMSYGAFASVTEDMDGLIHISQIARERINAPADLLQVGQVVTVKITEIDDEKQRISLSIKALLADDEEETEEAPEEETAETTEE